MELELSGKRVLLTGGTMGIGRAIAEAYLAEGARVAVCSRAQEHVDSFKAANAEQDVVVRAVDVADTVAVDGFVTEIEQLWGGVDIVVPTVSSMSLQPGDDSWDAAFQTDVKGTVHLVRACLPLLQQSKGSVVILGSTASSEISPHIVGMFGGEQPYGAAKAALVNYAKTLSAQLAPMGVRINVVSPGNVYVSGGAWDGFKQNAPELYATMLGENPMGRMASAQEVADCVMYLSSVRASFITGQNIIIDGGLTRSVKV